LTLLVIHVKILLRKKDERDTTWQPSEGRARRAKHLPGGAGKTRGSDAPNDQFNRNWTILSFSSPGISAVQKTKQGSKWVILPGRRRTMKDQPVFRDERTITIEHSSYRWGYFVITYGLLLIIAFRAFIYKESNWDLMALVILSGLITTAYQGLHKILSRRWIYLFSVTLLIAAVIAVVVGFLLK
jgi:hypothetical protein